MAFCLLASSAFLKQSLPYPEGVSYCLPEVKTEPLALRQIMGHPPQQSSPPSPTPVVPSGILSPWGAVRDFALNRLPEALRGVAQTGSQTMYTARLSR
jgi:hypothetical protein